MNDSVKLRCVYGILFLVGALICFGGAISLISLICVDILPQDILILASILFVSFLFTIVPSIKFFMEAEEKKMPKDNTTEDEQ